jgi:cell pole-organizing protein PopZ
VTEDDRALISEAVSVASIDAMAKLADAAKPEILASAGLSFKGSGHTVEDLVVEMIRPMLCEWLDENLPATVERIVQKEIRRLVRQAEPE